eukprot:754543_1
MTSASASTSISFRNTLMGSCFVASGQLIMATSAAIVKYSSVKESQLLFGRCATHLFISVCYWIILNQCKLDIKYKHWYGDEPHQIQSIWWRGFGCVVVNVCYWYSIIQLPLGDAECIFYQAPIVTAIFGAIFLKEKLPKMAPLICILGITGITFMLQPQFITTIRNDPMRDNDDVKPLRMDGVIAMVVAVLAWSFTCVLIRVSSTGTHFIQLDIAAGIQMVLISAPSTLLLNKYILHSPRVGDLDLKDWKWDPVSILTSCVLGVFTFCALSCSVIGYQYGEMTKVAWLEYITLIYAFAYQTFLFDDVPNTFEIIGAVLVVLACCVSLLEEVYNKYVKQTISYHPIRNLSSSDLSSGNDTS